MYSQDKMTTFDKDMALRIMLQNWRWEERWEFMRNHPILYNKLVGLPIMQVKQENNATIKPWSGLEGVLR